jgi:hypothetical protein
MLYTTNQNQKRIEQLIKEHPAIGTILKWERDTNTGGIIPEFDLVVNRADINLMMFQGERIDGFSSYLIGKEVEGKPVIITKSQTVYFVNHDDRLWDMIAWNGAHSRRVKEIFEFSEENSPNNLKYLILVTVYDSYQKDPEYFRKHPKSLGIYIAQKITLQLYIPPKEGFARLLEKTDTMKNIRLKILNLGRNQNPIYKDVVIEIEKAAKQFECEVCRKGLKETIDADAKDIDIKFSSVTLKILHISSGSIIYTFKKGDSSIILRGPDEALHPMTFVSIDATWPCAKSMIEEVIKEWNGAPAPRIQEYERIPYNT